MNKPTHPPSTSVRAAEGGMVEQTTIHEKSGNFEKSEVLGSLEAGFGFGAKNQYRCAKNQPRGCPKTFIRSNFVQKPWKMEIFGRTHRLPLIWRGRNSSQGLFPGNLDERPSGRRNKTKGVGGSILKITLLEGFAEGGMVD